MITGKDVQIEKAVPHGSHGHRFVRCPSEIRIQAVSAQAVVIDQLAGSTRKSRLCPHCKSAHMISNDVFEAIFIDIERPDPLQARLDDLRRKRHQ
jgi:hypothetical protein